MTNTLFTLPSGAQQSPAPFIRRRQALLATMNAQGGGIALMPTAPHYSRNRDSTFPYRFDSYFHYLSGFDEPDAVVVLIAGDVCKSILFCRSKDIEMEIWDGFRFGPEAAATQFGFDEAYPIENFEQHLVKLLTNQPTLWYPIGHDQHCDQSVSRALTAVRNQVRQGHSAPSCLRDIRDPLDEMRLIKDDDELAIMRRAAQISVEAHIEAMQQTRPGRYEHEIEAYLLKTFRLHGCQAPAYSSIVAGGANACVLHYVANNRLLNDGDLLLIDAGGELDGYAADITRTFPVNGRFSGAQRDIYQLVLAAQHAAFAATQPGATFNDPHDAAVRAIASGLLELKLLQGSLDEVLETESYRRFYMHRTGHWLGRDVHDAGKYKKAGQSRPLEPGMVLTIEPGCYIRAAEDIPKAFWDIGIRIEDDLAIRTGGHENLTCAVPTDMAEIEALMSHI